MSMRTVIYLRRSQDDDLKQIHSIPRQEEDILTFVKKYNETQEPEGRLTFDPVKDIVREDASAKKPGRKKFNEMVQAIKKHRYEVLLCTELSRLSRNAIDTGTLVQLLEDRDLKKIQTKDKVFFTTPTDKFTFALFLTVSKFENDQRAINTASGLAHQKSKGETTHKAPLGYLNAGEIKGSKWVEKDMLIWDNLRYIWELFLTGNYSISDLKKEADNLGIMALKKDGTREYPVDTTYRGMLRNKYYAGFVKKTEQESGAVEWIKKDRHPPMVTEQEFETAQLILQSRGYKHQAVAHAPNIDSILSEILICGKCTTVVKGIQKPTKMIFENKVRYTCTHCRHRYSAASKKPCPKCATPITESTKSDEHRYYRCGKKNPKDVSSHNFYGTGKFTKNLDADKIENFLDKQLNNLYISEKMFEVLKRQLYTLWEQDNRLMKKHKEKYMIDLKKLAEEKVKIQRVHLGKLSEDVDDLLDANRRDRQEVQEKLEAIEEEDNEKFDKAWQSLNALLEAKTVLGSQKIGLEPKRKILLSLVSNLKITDNKWEVEWRKPFAVLAKAGIAKKGRPKSGTDFDGDRSNWLPELDSNQQPPR